MARPAQSPQPSRIMSHSSALICQDTDLRGEITIGEGTVIHPKATVLAAGGPIAIGKNCVIEETAVIINRRKGILNIGDGNVFMIGCRVESPSIGDDNIFHPRSKASSLVHITNNCSIGAGTILLPLDPKGTNEETLAPYTVLFGAESSRRIWDGSNQAAEKTLRERHIEYVREIMPKFNRMRVV